MLKGFAGWLTILGVCCIVSLMVPAARADFIVSNNGSSGADNNTVVNVSATGVVTANSSGYSGPGGIGLDPTGTTLYVTNFNNGNGTTVSSVAAAGGTPTTFIPTSTGLKAPVAVATDSSGNVYVVDSGNKRVAEFNSSGSVVNLNFITDPNLSVLARGIAVDGSGNVYVTNGSTFREYSSAGGTTPILTVTGFSLAFGVALGTGSFAGFAFVSDVSNNKVFEVNLSNGTKAQFNTSGTALNAPAGLAFDNNGNLFVANNGNSTLSMITPAGVTSTFSTSGLALNQPIGIVSTQSASTPEPSSLLLSGLGLAMTYAYRRCSRRRVDS